MKKKWTFIGNFDQLESLGFVESDIVFKRQTDLMIDVEWDDVCVVKPNHTSIEPRTVCWNNPYNTESIKYYIEDLIEKGLVIEQ